MFHPVDAPMERGWPGRIDGEHVVQLAAQTLEAFFTGGGSAREHAVYPREAVRLLAPVLHPPAVRLFDGDGSFAFANPAAIVGPGTGVAPRRPGDDVSLGSGSISMVPRVAAVIGGGGAIAGFTILAEWRDPRHAAPKDRDFALGLGPVVATSDELPPAELVAVARVDGAERSRARTEGFDWSRARNLAAAGTTLRSGDLLGSPPLDSIAVPFGSEVELEVDGIGVLRQHVLRH